MKVPQRTAALIEPLMASVPDPAGSLRFLERLRAETPSAYDRVVNSPAALKCAVDGASYSRLLADSLVQDPDRILQVANSPSLSRVLSVEDYQARLERFLDESVPTAVDFARFRRRQLLRILLRDVLREATLANVTGELS